MLALKQRYIWTKNNKLRLRYVVSALALFASTGAASYKNINLEFSAPSIEFNMPDIAWVFPSSDDVKTERVAEKSNIEKPQSYAASALNVASDLDSDHTKKILFPIASIKADKNKKSDDLVSAPDFTKIIDAIKKPEGPEVQDLKVGSGDTLSELLQSAGVSVRDSILALRSMNKDFDPRRIRQGQELTIETSLDGEGNTTLDKLTLPVSVAKQIIVTRDGDSFESSVLEKDIEIKNFAKSLTIDSSLYASAARVGVPAQVIAELIRVYSWNVDFQRDIRSGDNLKVLYSVQETEDGEFAGYGDVEFADLTLSGKSKALYRYETKDGRTDYYEPGGASIRKTLMKTPVDGARLSSGYGMRFHPVLGYSKMHKGTDFAAPTGTPIYAAGDGVVEYAGRFGSYGNYVRIRHNGSLKTAYAHMQKFAKKVHKGSRVEQGQIIGYIGTTGRSTGPHLHYEVLKNSVQVNPNRIDLPVGDKLKGEEYARFKALVGVTKQEYANLAGDDTNLAKANSADKSSIQ